MADRTYHSYARTPIGITILMACHFSPDPVAFVGLVMWDSEAGRGARKWLLDNDLIDAYWTTTKKGGAWVKFICETPLPVAEVTWVLPPRP